MENDNAVPAANATTNNDVTTSAAADTTTEKREFLLRKIFMLFDLCIVYCMNNLQFYMIFR